MQRDKVTDGFQRLHQLGRGWSTGAALLISILLPIKYFLIVFGLYVIVILIGAVATVASPFIALYVFCDMTLTTWIEVVRGYVKSREQ